MEDIRDLLVDVFVNLNRAETRYAVLRNYEGLPSRPGKDVDILVDRDCLQQIEDVLLRCFCKHHYFAVKSRASAWAFTLTGVPIDSDERCTAPVAFHVVTHISVKTSAIERFMTGVSKKIMFRHVHTRYVHQDGVDISVLADRDEFLALYIEFVKKRKQTYLEKLSSKVGADRVREWIQGVLGQDDPSQALFGGQDTAKIVDRLVRDLWVEYSVSEYVSTHLRVLMDLLRGGSSAPPLVYLSGPDGSGKTTLHRRLLSLMEALGVRCTSFKTVHFAVAFCTGVLGRARSAIVRGRYTSPDMHARDADPPISRERDRDTKQLRWRVRRHVGLLVALLDAVIIGRVVVGIYRRLGYAVIVETSPYDIFVKRHRPVSRLLEAVFTPLIPRPSIGFLMEAEPVSIVNRKPELTLSEIVDYYNRLRTNIGKLLDSGVYLTIDTNGEPEIAMNELLEKLAAARFAYTLRR